MAARHPEPAAATRRSSTSRSPRACSSGYRGYERQADADAVPVRARPLLHAVPVPRTSRPRTATAASSVSFTLRNTGDRTGAEVAQVYAGTLPTSVSDTAQAAGRLGQGVRSTRARAGASPCDWRASPLSYWDPGANTDAGHERGRSPRRRSRRHRSRQPEHRRTLGHARPDGWRSTSGPPCRTSGSPHRSRSAAEPAPKAATCAASSTTTAVTGTGGGEGGGGAGNSGPAGPQGPAGARAAGPQGRRAPARPSQGPPGPAGRVSAATPRLHRCCARCSSQTAAGRRPRRRLARPTCASSKAAAPSPRAEACSALGRCTCA